MEKPIVEKMDNKVDISFLTLDSRAEKQVQEELESIFGNSKNANMKDLVYSCVKELMVNASKSNIKQTFLVESKITSKDKKIFNLARTRVKKLFSEHYFPYVQQKLKKHNSYVRVEIEEKKDGVVLTVSNPDKILKEDEARMRQLLSRAMHDDQKDLAEFFDPNDELAEGASLGLILVVQLLREMKIRPDYFRVGTIENRTMARIEIPFNDNYKSIRDLDSQ